MHYYKDMDGGVGAMDTLDVQFDAPVEFITKEEFERIIVELENNYKNLAEEYQTPPDTLI